MKKTHMKDHEDKAKKKKKSKGTLLAEKGRAEANKLTDSERERLTIAAMRLFHGGPARAHAHCG